jgi:rubrerythrin
LPFVATTVHSDNHIGYSKELANDTQVTTFLNEILESFKSEAKLHESRRSMIRKLADRMGEIKIRHGLEMEIGTVCTEIVKTFRKAGLTEGQLYNIYETFEKEEYKKYRSEIVYSRNLSIPGNLPEENNMIFNKAKESIKNLLTIDPNKLTMSQIQDLKESSERVDQRIEGICDEKRIPTFSTSPTSHDFYSMNKNADTYSEKIETHKPKYEWTVLSDSIERCSRLLHQLAIEAAEFPPQIHEDAVKYAKGFYTLSEFIEPGTDNKHKRSPMDWIKTLKSSIDSTINGTATMHPTESNLCEKCNKPDESQDPTGAMGLQKPVEMISTEITPDMNPEIFANEHRCKIERAEELIKKGWCWMCPKCSGIKGREIIISREHTSDMIKPTIDLVGKIVNHFPALIAFLGWYADWRRPILDAQTINLSPKLKMRKSG